MSLRWLVLEPLPAGPAEIQQGVRAGLELERWGRGLEGPRSDGGPGGEGVEVTSGERCVRGLSEDFTPMGVIKEAEVEAEVEQSGGLEEPAGPLGNK